MADVSYGITLNLDKDNFNSAIRATGVTATMSQAGLQSMTYTLATTTVSISTASLSSVGVAFFRNLATDTSATAAIGIVSGGVFSPFSTLRAGEPAITRLTSGVAYAAKGVAGTRLRVDVSEG